MKDTKKEVLTTEELIEDLSSNYRVSIAMGNDKLGKHIPNVNISVKVCGDVPCKKGCYARKGTFLFPSTKNAYNRNLEAYKMDKTGYFDEIIKFVDNETTIYKYFRWHSAGDIVDYDYLVGMVRVAEACQFTKFLCYTKKFQIVNMYLALHKLPKNLTIVFSGWDKDFTIPNPHNLPTTYVEFSKSERNIKDINKIKNVCSGSCETCKMCWNLKEGEKLVFKEH